MDKKFTAAGKTWLVITATCGWFALVCQFYLHVSNGTVPLPELVIRFFSYFTITTNLLVAVYCTTCLSNPDSRLGRFFSRLTTVTAITFYIIIVGAVYNIILRPLWKPEGLQKLVDELLHTLVPLLQLIFWLLFIPKTGLEYKDTLPWMIYPLVYIIYSLIRGGFSGWYPYPFVDVSELGLGRVLLNSVLFTGAFFVLSFLFVWIANRMRARVTG